MATTNKKTQFFEEHNLFNTSQVEAVTYYNPKTNMFEYRFYPYKVGKDLVEAPYIENFKHLVWEKFWGLLNEEETRRANSYTKKRGYFQFLREEALISYHDLAVELSKPEMIEIWEHYHGLNIDWNTVGVK